MVGAVNDSMIFTRKFIKYLSLILLVSLFLFTAILYTSPKVEAIGECSQYGFMATYDILTDSCKCSYGYVFDKDFLGNTTCVSGDSICYDKYGYGSDYDSLSNSCECKYGYVFGKDSIGRTQCITETEACQNQLGYNSRSTFGGQCECSYGYIIQGGQCIYGNTYCSLEHGLYSNYDTLSNRCECDDGYTLGDDGQCREKQNNVYFKLLDVDTDNKQAIIKSEYDSRKYLIEYGYGCYSFSIRRYINDQIVVNLGTDFDVDRWDRIVLQDDDEVCDIKSEERTYYDSFEEMYEEEEADDFDFIYHNPPPTPTPTYQSSPKNAPTSESTVTVAPEKKEFTFAEVILDSPKKAVAQEKSNLRKCPSSSECEVIKTIKDESLIEVSATYGDWYKVSKINEEPLTGWVYKTLINFDIESFLKEDEGQQHNETKDQNKEESAIRKVFHWFTRLF